MRQHHGFRRRRDLEDHFRNHEDDENGGFLSAEEYGAFAEAFLDIEKSDDLDECARASGVIVRYHRITQQFLLISPDGFIITYYLLKPRKESWPNNRAYFRSQCQRL